MTKYFFGFSVDSRINAKNKSRAKKLSEPDGEPRALISLDVH